MDNCFVVVFCILYIYTFDLIELSNIRDCYNDLTQFHVNPVEINEINTSSPRGGCSVTRFSRLNEADRIFNVMNN